MKNILLIVLLPTSFSAMDGSGNREQWEIKHKIEYGEHIVKTAFDAASNKLLVRGKTKTELLDVSSGESLRLGHTNNCWQPRFSPKSNYIITSPTTQAIFIYSIQGQRVLKLFTDHRYDKVALNREETQFLAILNNSIQAYDLEGQQLAQCEPGYCIKVCEFFPHDERLIFIAHHADNYAKIWDLRTKELIPVNYIGTLKKASIHKDGNYLACIPTREGMPVIVDLRQAKDSSTPDLAKPKLDLIKPRSAKFNSSGTHILGYSQGTSYAMLWNVASVINAIQLKQNHPKYLEKTTRLKRLSHSALFHPDGNRVLTYSPTSMYNDENCIALWDLEGNLLAKIDLDEQFNSAKFDQTGNYIITTQTDRISSNVALVWEKQ